MAGFTINGLRGVGNLRLRTMVTGHNSGTVYRDGA